jgi:hypothetical protein
VRAVLGFVVAPIAPAVIAVALILLTTKQMTGSGPFLVVGLFYACPAALMIGLPLYLIAKSKGKVTMARCVVSGSIVGGSIGGLIGGAVGLSFLSTSPWSSIVGFAALLAMWGATHGALSGFLFWLIAVRSSNLRWSGP